MAENAASPRRRPLLAGALLFVLVTAACSSSYYGVTREPLYSPAEFRYAAGDKALHTAIHGNPFALPPEQVASEILAAMQAASSSFDTALVRAPHFTLDAGARPDYAVMVILNPAEPSQVDRICSAEQAIDEGDSARSEAQVRMAFCRGPYLLSTSYGRMPAVRDPADPRFRRLIHNLTRELFPHREYRRGGQGLFRSTR